VIRPQQPLLLPVEAVVVMMVMEMVVVVVHQPVHEPAGKVLGLAVAGSGTGRVVLVIRVGFED
jgi:hypothetical protein